MSTLYSIARLYTRRQLRGFVPYIAALVRFLEPHFRGENAWLRLNPFLGEAELSLGDAAWGRFTKELQGGQLESFHWFIREPGRRDGAFPFVFRVESEPPNSIYYKRDLALEHGVAYPKPPVADYKIELLVDEGVAQAKGLTKGPDLERLLTSVFVGAQCTYGYLTTDTVDVAMQGISRLERDLGLYDSLYRHPWIDSYNSRIAGLFRHNFFGRRLAEGVDVPALSRAGARVTQLADGALHFAVGHASSMNEPMSSGPPPHLQVVLEALLPRQPEDRPALPSETTLAYLLSAEQATRVGGAAHIQGHLPVSTVGTLSSGGVVVSTELKRRSDDFLLRQHLWPLQPAKCELWEATLPGQSQSTLTVVLGHQEIARRQVRLRVAEADLRNGAQIPVLLLVGGRISKESLLRMQDSVARWVRDAGGALGAVHTTRRSLETAVVLAAVELGSIVALIEELSLIDQSPLLFSVGELSETERGMLERLLKPDSLYVRA